MQTFALLYVGPDQMLPLVSVLGGVVGVVLIWWTRFLALLRKVGRMVRPDSSAPAQE